MKETIETATSTPTSFQVQLGTSTAAQPLQNPGPCRERPGNQHHPASSSHLLYGGAYSLFSVSNHPRSPPCSVPRPVRSLHPLRVQRPPVAAFRTGEDEELSFVLKGSEHTCDILPLQDAEDYS